jgi:hypothetical protein
MANLYQWDLEERVEDALVAYLKTEIGQNACIKAALDFTTAIRFPLVSVHVQSSENVNDVSNFCGGRRLSCKLEVVTETNKKALMTAREEHRLFKSLAIGAVAYIDTAARVNETQPEGVTFSQIHMTQQDNSVGDYKLVTSQILDIVATPQEI